MVMSIHTKHVGVAEAKAQFARIVRDAPEQRTIIQRRGQDIAVVLGIEELRRLELIGEGATEGARMLTALKRWRERAGGFEGFAPERARLSPGNPFPAAKPRRKPP